jgi:hypothetical protein
MVETRLQADKPFISLASTALTTTTLPTPTTASTTLASPSLVTPTTRNLILFRGKKLKVLAEYHKMVPEVAMVEIPVQQVVTQENKD